MKVFLTSLSGSDKTESVHYHRVLQQLGHQVFKFVLPSSVEDPGLRLEAEPGFAPHVCVDALVRVAGFQPDLLIYIEPGGLIPRGIEKVDFPTACVLCDTHVCLKTRLKLARFFDHVFLYHRNYLKYFKEHPVEHVHWLPYACDLELFRPLGQERDLDVAFVGQHFPGSERSKLLRIVVGRYRANEQRYYTQAEIPAVYSRAKIVLNLPLADDLNFRTFEAMSCGAMLLTRRIANGQEILFEEGRHFAAFADERELVGKIDYYLAHPDERETIAAAGLAEIQQRHGLEQRVEELVDAVLSKPDRVAPIRRMTPKELDREYAWLYELLSRFDPGPQIALLQQARRAGRPWMSLLLPIIRSALRGTTR